MDRIQPTPDQYRDRVEHRRWFDTTIRNIPEVQPDYLSLDEAYEMANDLVYLEHEVVTEITPDAIVTQAGSDTRIYLLDEVVDTQSVDTKQAALVGGGPEASNENHNHVNSAPTGAGSGGTAGSFPRRLRSAERITGAVEIPKAANQHHTTTPHRPFHQITSVPELPADEEAADQTALEGFFADTEAPEQFAATTSVATPKEKAPNRIILALFPKRFMFKGAYQDYFGAEVPRRHIITGRAPYAGKVATGQLVSKTEVSEAREPAKPRTRRILGALAAGALVVTALGAAVGISGTQKHESSTATPVAAAIAEQPTFASSTTIKPEQPMNATLSDEEKQALQVIAAHPVEFANLVRWINEHPGEDFVAAYQQAFGA